MTACRHSGLSEEEFGTLHNSVKRGDLVGVKGFPGKSKRGELSVFPQSLLVLAPCLHMIPKHRLDNQVSSLEGFLPDAFWSLFIPLENSKSSVYKLRNTIISHFVRSAQ